MNVDEFWRKYDKLRDAQRTEEEDHSLRGQALKRARELPPPKVATAHEWEAWERWQREAESQSEDEPASGREADGKARSAQRRKPQ